MNTLQEAMHNVDLSKQLEDRKQAIRTNYVYKDGVREATKDIMDYLEANGMNTRTHPELIEYLKDLYYSGQTKFFNK